MSAGLIQLVAKGKEDLYLIGDPQITLFKMIYRRHTNFAIQQSPLHFLSTPDFNKKVSLNIEKQGDLVYKLVLVITLPEIPKYYNIDGSENNIIKYAWSKNISYVIIKNIEIELADILIDRQYGEWLYIWHELFDDYNDQYNKMSGNIKELYEFTDSKPEYKLFIPLHFYFCENISSSFPLICLNTAKLKLNLELNDLSQCLKIAPSHYIDINDPFVNFEVGEHLIQFQNKLSSNLIDNKNTFSTYSIGRFIYFDEIKKRLYYQRTTNELFKNSSDGYIYGDNNLVSGTSDSKPYIITNKPNLKIKDCFLITDYIYLEQEERNRLKNNDQTILINQIQYNGEDKISGDNTKINIDFKNCVSFMCWVSNYSYLHDVYNNEFFDYSNYEIDLNNNQQNIIKSSLIKQNNILFNENLRIGEINNKYFSNIQQLKHFKNSRLSNINVYSFSINPLIIQPSGSCNMTELNDIKIEVYYNKNININSLISFRAYALSYNTLLITDKEIKLLY